MLTIPESMAGMAEYKQFILWTKVYTSERDAWIKLPLRKDGSRHLKDSGGILDAAQYMTMAEAIAAGAILNLSAPASEVGVGFVFTEEDPFFFFDMDKCFDGGAWIPERQAEVQRVCGILQGGAYELSQSRNGFHIFGRYDGVESVRKMRNKKGMELYTKERFVALTGLETCGSTGHDMTAAFRAVVSEYFEKDTHAVEYEGVDSSYTGDFTDDEIIEKAMNAKSNPFATQEAGFTALWQNDEEALAVKYPPDNSHDPYNRSAADFALASHLAFWTGRDCERIERLMRRSELVRVKWDREDYFANTISGAAGTVPGVYSIQAADNTLADQMGGGALKAAKGSEAQQQFAEKVRSEKLAAATPEEREILCAPSGLVSTAKWWLDNKDANPHELVGKVIVSTGAIEAGGKSRATAQAVTGVRYMSREMQFKHFEGCAYVVSENKIFTPDNGLLKRDEFKVVYGGYTFQIDDNDKTSTDAWDVFTITQAASFPMVNGMTFNPKAEPSFISEEAGRHYINTYVEPKTKRVKGDPSPFLKHISNLLPCERDQRILLSYLAACLQYKGVKFQWAPVVQGAPGNGKTLLLICMEYALGEDLSHRPPAPEISEKFNAWLFGKLFIGVDEFLVPSEKVETIETIKPMITNSRMSRRAMRSDQVMMDNYANFLLLSNHKDCFQKTRDDRRFAVMFTAQQSVDDFARCGMSESYFGDLYDWLNERDGLAIVNELLNTYPIDPEFNPAGACKRAPQTSSTEEAINLGGSVGIMGRITELMESEAYGFKDGWVCPALFEDAGIRFPPTPQALAKIMAENGFSRHAALSKDRGRLPGTVSTGKGDRRVVVYLKDGSPHHDIFSPKKVYGAFMASQGAVAEVS